MTPKNILTPVKSDHLPSKFISLLTVSIQDNPNEPGPSRLLGVGATEFREHLRNGEYSERRDLAGSAGCDFWNWLTGQLYPGTRTWVCALGLYESLVDLGFFTRVAAGEFIIQPGLDWDPPLDIDRSNWRGFLCLENPPTIIQAFYKSTGASLTMVDLGNYCALGWDDLGIDWFDGQLNEDSAPAFCRDHSLRVGKAFAKIIGTVKGLQLGALQVTAASQAMYGFRRHEIGDGVNVPGPVIHLDTDEKTRAGERLGLYSGRCECRVIGSVQGPIYHLDINSCYPYIFSITPVPTKLIRSMRESPTGTAFDSISANTFLGDVTVRVDKPMFPMRHEDIVIWPVGEFRTILPGPELELARQNDSIVAVHGLAEYQCETIGREWSGMMFSEKLRAKNGGDIVAARFIGQMMQSLVGKFSQRPQRWVHAPEFPAPEPWGTWWQYRPDHPHLIQYRSMAGVVQKCLIGEESRTAWPALTAWVTSGARVMLWRLMECAGRSNVYYYDTDSLWVNSDGYQGLSDIIDDGVSNMGRLKVVSVHSHVEFLGIKHYIADGVHTCAGMTGSGTIKLVEDNEDTVLRNGSNCAKTGTAPFHHRDIVRVAAKRRYRHGKVNGDGRINPFVEE